MAVVCGLSLLMLAPDAPAVSGDVVFVDRVRSIFVGGF